MRVAGLCALGIGWCVACGGESRGDGQGSAGTPSAGHGGRPNAGSGGSTAGGGAAATASGGLGGGAGGSVAGAPCDWSDRPPSLICVPSCASSVTFDQILACVDGAWGCGPPFGVDVSQCPPDSCARASDHECCETDNGHRTAVTCTPEGPIEPCPEGSVNLAPRQMCLAAGVTADSCQQLDEQPCARAGDRCGYVRSCSVSCECNDSDMGLRWVCIAPVC
jgi:hypothetical protein